MRCSLPSMSRITVHSRLGASSPQAGHSTSVVRIPPHPHRMYWLHSANHDWPSESDLYHKRSILPKRSMTTKKAHQAGPVQCTQRGGLLPDQRALGKKSPSFRTMSPESITSGAAWLIGNEGCSAQHGSGRGERSGPPNWSHICTWRSPKECMDVGHGTVSRFSPKVNFRCNPRTLCYASTCLPHLATSEARSRSVFG